MHLPSQIFITVGDIVTPFFHLLIIALLGVSPSMENGSVLFVANLACWSIGTSFCRVPDVETVKTESTGCQFLDSIVDIKYEELMALLRRVIVIADVAAFRQRCSSFVAARCRYYHCCRFSFHSFAALDDCPCLNHIDEMVKGEGDALDERFMVFFPELVRQVRNSIIDNLLQEFISVAMVQFSTCMRDLLCL